MVELPPGVKLVRKSVAGPASYASGGFTVDLPEIRDIVYILKDGGVTGGGYIYNVDLGTNPNQVKIKAFYFDYAAAAAGAAIEVAAGTNLSGETFTIVVVGY